jgi:Ion transport protein
MDMTPFRSTTTSKSDEEFFDAISTLEEAEAAVAGRRAESDAPSSEHDFELRFVASSDSRCRDRPKASRRRRSKCEAGEDQDESPQTGTCNSPLSGRPLRSWRTASAASEGRASSSKALTAGSSSNHSAATSGRRHRALDPPRDGGGDEHNLDSDDDDDDDDDDDSNNRCILMEEDSSSGSIEIDDSSLPMLDSSARNLVERERNGGKPTVSPSHQSSLCKNAHAARVICGKIVNHRCTQLAVMWLIILNALVMGVATFNFVDDNPRVTMIFEKLDTAFLIAFTVESSMQLIFYGLALFKDGWLTFDLTIVVLSWTLNSIQIFRSLRTFRLVGRIPLLRNLVDALMLAIPRLGAIVCLFLLIMYIYAVMITILFGDMYERQLTQRDYFSRLDITAFTLFQMITLDWANIVREIMQTYPWANIIFASFLSFTSFVLFSLMIGVVCDAVQCIEHDALLEGELEMKENAQERILRLQQRVDYLQKQQKSVLASVQSVLDEIAAKNKDSDPYNPQTCLLPAGIILKPSVQTRLSSVRSSLKSSLKASGKKSSSRSVSSRRSNSMREDDNRQADSDD